MFLYSTIFKISMCQNEFYREVPTNAQPPHSRCNVFYWPDFVSFPAGYSEVKKNLNYCVLVFALHLRI
uniref:Uncharacterized protein n=1 Tax=Setaria italica TaxID=4555 RepID=K3ZPS4_SETIT